MVELTRVIDIAASQDDVFDYVSDFRRAHEWRTEVLESTMEPPGRMRTGSRLRELATVAGRPVTTHSVVNKFEPSHRFTFEHVSGPVPVSGEYAVTPRLAEPGRLATLRYTLRVRLVGGWRLLAPLINLTAPATIHRSLRRLASRIESGTL